MDMRVITENFHFNYIIIMVERRLLESMKTGLVCVHKNIEIIELQF